MRKSLVTIIAAAALATGIGVAPALYAHDSQGSNMGSAMMGGGTMIDGGMMKMMGQMGAMMENCNKVMQSMMDNHGPAGQNNPPQKEGGSEPEK